MKHPAYHLRYNKAVDRFRLVEILRVLEKNKFNLNKYTYYGLGGPFLEDFRLMGEFFPAMRMVSMEADSDTHRRQKFHQPHKRIELKRIKTSSFIAQFQPRGRNVFWLDYTGLEPACFDDFSALLSKMTEYSIVKITLNAEMKDYPPEKIRSIVDTQTQIAEEAKFVQLFRDKFGEYVPADLTYNSFKPYRMAALVEEMVKIAAQGALPHTDDDALRFQLLDSCYYSDQTQMICVTGIVCNDDQFKVFEKYFDGNSNVNFIWTQPVKIDIPILSTKERLHIEKHLPRQGDPGIYLNKRLGYKIDNTLERSRAGLKQYAQYSAFLPYFVKSTP